MTAPPDTTPRDWHLDRRLQITHLVSTVVLGVSAILYVAEIRKDVEVLKAKEAAQHQRDYSQDRQADQARAETLARMERIDNKLDRLIEYSRGPQRNGGARP